MSTPGWNRLVRFKPQSDEHRILIGEPVSPDQDVGLATYNKEVVEVNVYSGSSVLNPGHPTGTTETVKRLLSPLAREEVGTIRCLGLNYEQHAREAKMELPKVPTIFMKPSTALADPYPAPTRVPRFTPTDDCCDFESELAVIIGKRARDVSESDALNYVLGYAAANDVSHRDSQFAQSQWCYSKSFDGACPLGPCIVSTKLVPSADRLHIRGLKNGKVMQDCGCDDLIFKIPRLISFLSRGTTIEPGTVIVTGTPAGVGFGHSPPEFLREGDVFAVEILPGIGTLVNQFEDMKKPRGPFKLVTVNTAPERAKRLVGRVAHHLAAELTIEHVDNCETIDAVKATFEKHKPDMMFAASMWTDEQAQEIMRIAREVVPDIRTHAIPHGMQVEQGPDYVVEYLTDQVPKMLEGL